MKRLFKTTSCPRTRRARTRRTRSCRARATCSSRSRARRSTRGCRPDLPYVIPRQTMLIDIYIAAVDERASTRTRANAFSRYLKSTRAEGPRPRTATGRSTRQALTEYRPSSSRSGPGETRSRQADRRLARGRQEVVRPEQRASWRQIEKTMGGRPLAARPSLRRRGSGRRSDAHQLSERAARPSRSVLRHDVPARSIVALPIAALVWSSTENGGRRILGRRRVAAGARGASSSRSRWRRSPR